METTCPNCEAVFVTDPNAEAAACPACGAELDEAPPLVRGAIVIGSLQDFLEAVGPYRSAIKTTITEPVELDATTAITRVPPGSSS